MRMAEKKERKASDLIYNRDVKLGRLYRATILPTEEEDYPYRVVLISGDRATIVSDRTKLKAFDKVYAMVTYIDTSRQLIEVEIYD